MKKPEINDLKDGAETALVWLKEHGQPIVKQTVETGKAALKTKIGKRIVTGALAGGAIAYALPVITITTGAVLGGGLMLFLKTALDKDPPGAN